MSEPQKILYEGKEFYIQREGTHLVAITLGSATEYSRLDIKTKKAMHWYARKICDRIYHFFRNEEKPLEILCLGSAMGAIPYELLSHYPKARVSCVDIDRESLYIAQQAVLKEFEGRVTYYEGDAKNFVLTVNPDSYDILINDLFTEQDSPPFIHSQSFLRACFRCLKQKGLYFANTISDTFEFTHGTAIEKIGYDTVRYTKRKEGITNIVYEAIKD
jgi:SAM-dependent methyltransferase